MEMNILYLNHFRDLYRYDIDYNILVFNKIRFTCPFPINYLIYLSH